MTYLLDTNVVSELRKVSAGKAAANVARWSKSVVATELYLSAMTIFELELGMLRIARRDAAQAAMLKTWIEQWVLPAFASRVLPIDAAVARRCAPLHVPDPRPERDAMIAATALTHGKILVTRNLGDFQDTGLTLLNPWDAA